MKMIFNLLFCLLLAGNLNAQTFEWLRTQEVDYEYNPASIDYTVCTDNENNVYFFGMKEHLTFYNFSMGHQFIKKYSSDGVLNWEKFITGEAHALAILADAAGGIYLAGNFITMIDFWGELTLDYSGITPNNFIVKINAEGEVLWGTILEDYTMVYGNLYTLTTDQAGLVYIAYTDFMDSWILIMNEDGTIIDSIVQENVMLITGIDVDNSGNIFASGGCANLNSTFGGVIFPAPFSYATYVVKYNSSHEPQWVRYIEDITCSQFQVKSDQSGGVYLAGQFFPETELDTISINGSNWVYDFILTRLSPTGEFLWAIECPEVLTGDATVGHMHYLETDGDGNVVMTGFTRGSIDWGNGMVTNQGDMYYSVIVWNVSPSGLINWMKTAGGAGYDEGESLAVDQNGDVYLAGVASGSVTFDTIELNTDDSVFPFLAKIQTSTTTTIIPTFSETLLPVYPNPANDLVNLISDGSGIVKIFDIGGNLVMTGEVDETLEQINVSGIPRGFYFIRYYSTATIESFRSKLIVR